MTAKYVNANCLASITDTKKRREGSSVLTSINPMQADVGLVGPPSFLHHPQLEFEKACRKLAVPQGLSSGSVWCNSLGRADGGCGEKGLKNKTPTKIIRPPKLMIY